MKKNSKTWARFLRTIFCFVLVMMFLSITVYAAAPARCSHCGATGTLDYYGDGSVLVSEWTMDGCANTIPGASHTHYLYDLCDNYICKHCGAITSVYIKRQEFCPFGNMSRIGR